MATKNEFTKLRAELSDLLQQFDEVSAQRGRLHNSLKDRLTVDAAGRFGIIREFESKEFDDVSRRHAELGECVRYCARCLHERKPRPIFWLHRTGAAHLPKAPTAR
jgi:hypothetical protein